VFASVPIEAIDLQNKKIPATIVQNYISSACVINVWRDMYVYEYFKMERDCLSVIGTFDYQITGVMNRHNVRYCEGHGGNSIIVLPTCGCCDKCTVKSSKMYAILRVNERSKYVISFDTITAKAYWKDVRCICEPLVDAVAVVFFDWIRRYGDESFNEEVMYEWKRLDVFRKCNGQILKMVTKDEMVAALMKALEDKRKNAQ
jgi:hypothetical protein